MGQPKAKVKILYVITQGEMGGAQRYVLDLAEVLMKKNYEALVAVGAEKSDLEKKLGLAGIPVRILPKLIRNIHPIRDWEATLELKKLIVEYQPDIVHLNSSKAGVSGSFAARLAGVRNVIFTAHGFAFLEPRGFWTRQIYYWAERLASRYRAKIITVSDFDRQAAIKTKIAPSEKFVVIHNGIDLSASKYRNIEISRSAATIGTIANLYKTKGLIYLVEAAKLVIQKFPNVKFVVIGEGSERKNLESRIENLELSNNFQLLGAKPNASEFLSQFNIFVLPSIKEGFPYTILEAMAAGLPIIATKVGGIPEAIEDGRSGILVPPQEPQALAAGIIDLLTNPDKRNALGKAAQERVKEFSLEKMVEETEKVYRELI